MGWTLALGCAGGTLSGKWLLFPLSKQLRGMHYSLGGYSPGLPAHFVPWSFGCLAALLIFGGALLFHLQFWRALACLGTLLLWLTFFGGLKPVLTDARLLQTLNIEFTQQQSAIQFAQKALPVNLGLEPSLWPRLDLSSVESRLLAGWYFVHGGWWAALLAGGLAQGYGAWRGRSAWIPCLAGVGLLLMLLICALGPIRAELTLARARASEAWGDLAGAEHGYREAMRLDPWQALAIDTHAALGGLDAARDRRDSPEYHVYHAQLVSTQVDLPAALAELRATRLSAPKLLADIIRKREIELLTFSARTFHALGAYGAAASSAEQALELDPDSLLPGYYLSRDCYLVGRYSQAISLSTQLLTRVDDPSIRANLFSNAGDAYTQLGNHVEAKVAYRNSYRYDYVLNLRALSALNGPGVELQ